MTLKSLVFLVCRVIARGARIERRTHTHTDRHTDPSTVTLAAHARRGLILKDRHRSKIASKSGISYLPSISSSKLSAIINSQKATIFSEPKCRNRCQRENVVNVVSFPAFIFKNEVWLISTHAQEYRLRCVIDFAASRGLVSRPHPPIKLPVVSHADHVLVSIQRRVTLNRLVGGVRGRLANELVRDYVVTF